MRTTRRVMHKAMRFTTFVFVLFLAGIALAQTGTISGTVLDKSGAVIPAAKVSATDLATGTSRSVETSATGAFTIPNLAPTVYEVKAEKAGFGAVKYERLTLHVAQVLSLTVKMNVGAQTEAIEVNGGQVAPIETGTSELSYVIDSKTISDL